MADIAATPSPPYYAVIFTSKKSENDLGYVATSERMIEMALQQKGFLGFESAKEGLGITVSYWASLESIKQWKDQVEHKDAQRLGRKTWYAAYKVRISKVERDYGV